MLYYRKVIIVDNKIKESINNKDILPKGEFTEREIARKELTSYTISN